MWLGVVQLNIHRRLPLPGCYHNNLHYNIVSEAGVWQSSALLAAKLICRLTSTSLNSWEPLIRMRPYSFHQWGVDWRKSNMELLNNQLVKCDQGLATIGAKGQLLPRGCPILMVYKSSCTQHSGTQKSSAAAWTCPILNSANSANNRRGH